MRLLRATARDSAGPGIQLAGDAEQEALRFEIGPHLVLGNLSRRGEIDAGDVRVFAGADVDARDNDGWGCSCAWGPPTSRMAQRRAQTARAVAANGAGQQCWTWTRGEADLLPAARLRRGWPPARES